ncbi:hypothetical protein DYBT9275_02983 [Dyadobacter sp. CECT 9275]|uniref:Uncharacterized protein n=1 Tax=Dyadobacter helix TaxID=2822344 RepID=A0A916JCQ7_9BACT|nr:hypothetical protein [Dyadobacter sp. CECT 9275]CAG5002865.1 hypothetical protein DYBT9275_02983 [Dyadobacter sp. CECT 9275]
MTKKKIIFILLAVVIVLAGYFAFKWFRGSGASWKFIPSSAIVVITSEHLQDSSYLATEVGLDLKRLPLVDIASDNLSLLNLLTRDQKKLYSFLNNKQISYSYHPRTATEWGVILYIPVNGEEEAKWLASPGHSNIKVLHHSFQDNRITDINDTNSRPLFSYIVKDQYLIASYYGDLIEDVIRTSSISIQKFELKSRFSKIDDTSYGTSIYLKADAWKSVIPDVAGNHYSEFARSLPALQDFHIGDDKDNTGLTIRSDGSATPDHYLAKMLADGPGSKFTGHKHISQQTSLLYRYAAADKETFHDNFASWHQKYKSPAWDKLYYYIGKESELFLDNFGAELILCQQEENNSISDGKILLAEYSSYDKLRLTLQKLSKLSNDQTNTSMDKFQGYDIFAIGISEFPGALFGNSFNGFSKTYVTYIAPYLVMSNNAQVLQNYIVDFENQITWKQSPEYDSVLTTSKTEAQVSLVVNLRKLQSEAGGYRGKTYTDLTSKIESVVIQCYYDGDEVFPEISLFPKKRSSAAKVLNRTFLNIDIEWPEILDKELAALQNPVDGSSEILLTDKEFNLLKIDNLRTGKPENISRLNGNLNTESYKVDFLNIGRQQRVFATARSVYAIDEDDSTNYSTFTQSLPSADNITALYLIDGGEDGSNRFVIKSSANELFLWESVGKPLRKLTRSVSFENLAGPVMTLNQIGNRGFIVTQRNGKIYLLGENGAIRRGFPTDILTRTESAFTWAQNHENGQPELLGVSVSGELIRISLEGKIVARKQLLRPEPGATFRILYDRNSLDWILTRSTRSKTAIIGKDGNDLFEIKDILPDASIQYHFFGVDNRFISIKSGSYSTIFDMTGKRLGDKAIPSEMPVKLTYQPGYYKLLVFSRSEKKIQVWSIKLR